MIPQAGSAYAYSYATLGELVAWIIGWDLILEYAVGNVAVAISWGDYFNTLLRGVGVDLPGLADDRLPHGAAQLESRRARPAARRRRTSPASRSCVNLPAFGIVMLITWLLLRGARESAARQQHHGGRSSCWCSALFIVVGATHINPANYTPFAPNGFTGIHQGAAIVFFAYIGFDAISTAAEETTQPAAQPADRHPRRAGDLHGDLRHRRRRADRHGAVHASSRWPIRWRARSSWPASRRVGWIVALGAAVSMSAVLLVFQYGQPRIFFAMARDGLLPAVGGEDRSRRRAFRTRRRSSPASSWRWRRSIGDAAETYDLTNIGTLFAFALVCVGVLVLRVKEPDRPRPFRVPFVWPVAPARRRRLPLHHGRACRTRRGSGSASGSSSGCVLYVVYGYRHSRLRRG